GFRLAGSVPCLPRRAQPLPAIEATAVQRRVDLQVARIELDVLAKSYGLTNATRFINLLEVAGVSKTQREADGARGSGGGFEVEFQVPIFDFGEVRVRQAEQTYMQAVNRLADKAIRVRSEARDAYRSYRSTYDIARHYDNEIVPLRKIISDEMILRYGAMQIDVFALLAEARQRINSNVASIEALRDFWLANTDLGVAVVGGGASGIGEAPRTIASGAAEPAGGT